MDYTVTFADLQEQHTAVVRGTVALADLPPFLGAAFADSAAVARSQGVELVGPPFGRYRIGEGGVFHVEAGFPVSSPVTPAGRVEPAGLPGGRVARTIHAGAYDDVASAYDAAERHVVTQGYEPTDAPWESYLDDPDVAAPRTEVFLPCRPVTAVSPAQASGGRSL